MLVHRTRVVFQCKGRRCDAVMVFLFCSRMGSGRTVAAHAPYLSYTTMLSGCLNA